MKVKNITLALVVIILLLPLANIFSVQAGGMPGGGQFGFGARMDSSLAVSQASSGSASSLALALAAQSHLNWIAFNLDWSAVVPNAAASPDLTGLAKLITEAQQQNMEILLSIQNPPDWAMTATGPSPEAVHGFLNQVSLVAANRVLVIELFPGANLSQAWHAPANPAAYLAVLQAARSALRTNQQVSLVIPSLTPQFQAIGETDISAEDFLTALYQLSPNENFQIVGLHFDHLTGSPADYSQPGSGAFLRQYETIRQVMLDHDRSSEQMWITAFAWPETLTNEADQASWVESAYRQMQGQIYIKAAFFNALFLGTNPGASTAGPAALLQPTLKAHSALTRIRTLAAQATGLIPASPAAGGPGSPTETSPLAKLWDLIRSLMGWR